MSKEKSNMDLVKSGEAISVDAVEVHNYAIASDKNFDVLANLSAKDKMRWAMAETLLRGDAVKGYEHPSDILQAMDLADHLNCPISWVLANYTPMKGKLTQNTEARGALAQAGGVWMDIIYNYKPLRLVFIDDGAEGIQVQEHVIMDDPAYIIFKNHLELTTKANEAKGKIVAVWGSMDDSCVYDYISRVKGTIVLPNGKEHTVYGQYRISEARAAGLLSKDNWTNYPADCLLARAKKRMYVNIKTDNFHFPSTEELASIDNIVLDKTQI